MTLEEFRREKDNFFASSRSPLPAAVRSGFTGLRYYPPEPALRFQLPLEVDAARESLVMHTSTGDERVYERLGWVNFEVDGTRCQLALYAPEGDLEPEAAFVPFRDATSGSETYGSGRYLEAELHGNTVTLDFNLAYNPYCAYSEGWSCPIPPRENWLTTSIRAGEQNLELEASA
ncbi:MAG: DUF1684 domain-containing protein [Pleurocapsa sp. SU_196_0]|nr:DUF1684 domain-containing protein [Pleurocapsa sp. SU_196_0]